MHWWGFFCVVISELWLCEGLTSLCVCQAAYIRWRCYSRCLVKDGVCKSAGDRREESYHPSSPCAVCARVFLSTKTQMKRTCWFGKWRRMWRSARHPETLWYFRWRGRIWGAWAGQVLHVFVSGRVQRWWKCVNAHVLEYSSVKIEALPQVTQAQ